MFLHMQVFALYTTLTTALCEVTVNLTWARLQEQIKSIRSRLGPARQRDTASSPWCTRECRFHSCARLARQAGSCARLVSSQAGTEGVKKALTLPGTPRDERAGWPRRTPPAAPEPALPAWQHHASWHLPGHRASLAHRAAPGQRSAETQQRAITLPSSLAPQPCPGCTPGTPGVPRAPSSGGWCTFDTPVVPGALTLAPGVPLVHGGCLCREEEEGSLEGVCERREEARARRAREGEARG